VALNSFATDLVSGRRDTNGAQDIFLYAAGSAQISPVSQRAPELPSLAAGGVSGVSTSPGSSVSANGRWIAFVSDAATLVAGQDDTNAATDVFLRDIQTGTTLLISHAAGSPARAANGPSDAPSIDRDGRYVAFQSTATDLVAGQEDGPESTDVFLYDRVTGTTTLVSHANAGAKVAAGGELPLVSANGKVVAFEVADEASGTNGLFLYDREHRATLLVSRDASVPALSTDGRFVAFLSGSPDLVPGDTNPSPDVFLFDRIAGTTTLVTRSAASPGQTANGGSYPPAISADGRFVAFASDATDLAPGVSPDSAQQVYLYDRVSRHLELVSHAAGSTTTPGDGPSDSPALDAEGRFLVFTSEASNLAGGSPEGGPNVFLYDRVRRTATLVPRPIPALRDGDSFQSGPAAISADGRRIAFASVISNLVPGQVDGNGLSDLFLYDREEGTTVLLDHLLGSPVTAPALGAEPPLTLSADGRCVGFETSAPGLVSADFNARKDVFLACLGEQD
jgi:Tol biopolymer transport system component